MSTTWKKYNNNSVMINQEDIVILETGTFDVKSCVIISIDELKNILKEVN
jgi:hypothetical protein